MSGRCMVGSSDGASGDNARALDQAASALVGDLNIEFDPDDPASVDAAVAEMRRLLESKLARFGGNVWVKELLTRVQDDTEGRMRATSSEVNGRAPKTVSI